MNQHQTTVHQLDRSDLTDRMARVAIALLARVNDRGEIHITRTDACAICQVQDANTVAKYLARLAGADILDWKGGNGAFHIWFNAWSSGASDSRPLAAKATPPAASRASLTLAIDPPPAAAKWTPWSPNQPPAANTTPPAAGG